MTNNNLVHIGDVLAIPLFALLTYYFYNKKNKNNIENILYIFAITGFIADTYFTYNYYFNKQ